MNREKLSELSLWIHRELRSLDHGEIHVILKVRDGRLALIEKTKIVKEKPEGPQGIDQQRDLLSFLLDLYRIADTMNLESNHYK